MPPSVSSLQLAQTTAPGLTNEEIGWIVGGGFLTVAALGYLILKLVQAPHERRAKLNPTMDVMQVEGLMHGTPPIIVDLRSPEAFKGKYGHLRGALNIPFPQLKERMDELRGTTGNRPIILVDDTDRLSHIVVPIMRYEGFEWFYVMKGGMKAWVRHKLPTYR